MENKCLYCYTAIDSEEEETQAGGAGYHTRCSKKFFGSSNPPTLEFAENDMLALAAQIIKSRKTVTGVQPKLSLGLSQDSEISTRLTLVGLWGEYILKPQTEFYSHLPENEDLTMRLAEISKIETVEHTLIRLKEGKLAYLTKRIDRDDGRKIHMEDMCQLTERLTEYKYKGSYEQIAKIILKHSANLGLDLVNFYELVIFSFLTGNNDMHLKNFSLIKRGRNYTLCPAYDLVSSALVVEGDDEDLALNLNGKKKKIKRFDFERAMVGSGMDEKVVNNIFKKFQKLVPKWFTFIDKSFLPEEMRVEYKELIKRKAQRLELKILE